MTADCRTLPLARAAWRGDIPTVDLLLDLGAEIDKTNDTQVTPLMWSIRRNHFGVASVLLARKANPNLTCKKGWSAIDYAVMYGHYDIAFYLHEKYAIKPQAHDFYQSIYSNNEFGYPYVKYEIFVDGINHLTPKELVEDFWTPPKRKGNPFNCRATAGRPGD